MCNTDCDVVFAKGICGLEWQLSNLAMAAQLGMLCARLPHFYQRKENCIAEITLRYLEKDGEFGSVSLAFL